MTRSRWAIVVAALIGVQVGTATVVSRVALAETDPLTLALLRYMIGVASLAPLALAGPKPHFSRRDLVPMAALGILQFAVLVALLNVALLYIPAGRAALVFASFPLLTMLLSAALGRERLTPLRAVGVALTFVGVALALGDKASAAGADTWIGDALSLTGAVCGAVCAVFYRPYLQRYPTLPVSTYAMLASVVFLAALAVRPATPAHLAALSGGTWIAIVFVGVSSGIGYFGWLWALANTTPTRATMFQALAPMTAALLGFTFLGEPLSGAFLAGLALVATGLVVAMAAPGQRPSGA